jgi:anthranilate phosphoribosyltransferase
MIREAIAKLVERQSLSRAEAEAVMNEIMEGQATPSQLGAFLAALRMKEETAEEIAGLAAVMRSRAIPVSPGEPVLDIVGTGGDNLNTFNISTAAALVAAGAGVKVAKHGNRAASGRCGAADVLEKLGVKIDLNAQQVQLCIRQAGIGFMFAPAFHPAMKFAAPTRREIGTRTVFNLLGPLTNPARAEYLVIGAPSRKLAEKIVSALAQLEVEHAIVVNSENGMDEISLCGPSACWEISGGQLKSFRQVNPRDFGLAEAPLSALQGGSPEENARTILEVMSGRGGPQRDVVLFNAAAGMVAAGRAADLGAGISIAAGAIDSGAALTSLKRLIEVSGRENSQN